MAKLTYKDIAYIRAALECKLEDLRWTMEQNDNGKLDPPLTDDEDCDMGNDFLYYDYQRSLFTALDMQPGPLQLVPKKDSKAGKKGGTD